MGRLNNGSVLCGGVGSGKSITAIAYYYLKNGGDIGFLKGDTYTPMDDINIKDLYIITTALKRDKLEWESELIPFLLDSKSSLYSNKIIIDSWNNIKKYVNIENAFFIFDEQRVVGSGVWVKSFLKIVKKNEWILLSATPGDTWQDYIPLFIANGFYKNRTEFNREHIIYSYITSFPKIERYLNTGKLLYLRSKILIQMNREKNTIVHHEDIFVDFDSNTYKKVGKDRWNIYKDEPIINASGLCYVWRRIVNSNEERQIAVKKIVQEKKKVIIFYNFDYELDILRNIDYGNADVAEWNGHKHEELPKGKAWVYLVQYSAGCEGWNCISTDTIIFYSQNYSYKVMTQAAGRIDRLNTSYKDLYYYHIKSHSGIDMAISKALKAKKNFNENSLFAK